MHDEFPGPDPEFERVCAALESVAGASPEGSEEAEAVKEAAGAYVFLQLHLKLRRSYEAFRRMGLEGLADEPEQNLRSMGIDPDEG